MHVRERPSVDAKKIWGLLDAEDRQHPLPPAAETSSTEAGVLRQARQNICGFKHELGLPPALRRRILIQGLFYVLHIYVVALHPYFPGDHFAFSIKKERRR